MQLVRGRSLHEVLAAHPAGRYTTGSAERVVRSLCHALSEAHRHGLVHRDVKPQNVIASAGGHVFLVDFGVATRDRTGLSDPFDATDIAGTYGYIPPEGHRGQQPTPAWDLWSVGVLGHVLLTGTAPYDLDEPSFDDYERCLHRLDEALPDPSAFSLLQSLGRMLDPDPDFRGSAGEYGDSGVTAALPRPPLLPREVAAQFEGAWLNLRRSVEYEHNGTLELEESSIRSHWRSRTDLEAARRHIAQDEREEREIDHGFGELKPMEGDELARALKAKSPWTWATGRYGDDPDMIVVPSQRLEVFDHPECTLQVGPAIDIEHAFVEEADLHQWADEATLLEGAYIRMPRAVWIQSVRLWSYIDNWHGIVFEVAVNGVRVGTPDDVVSMGSGDENPASLGSTHVFSVPIRFGPRHTFADAFAQTNDLIPLLRIAELTASMADDNDQRQLRVTPSLMSRMLLTHPSVQASEPFRTLCTRIAARRAWSSPTELLRPNAEPHPAGRSL